MRACSHEQMLVLLTDALISNDETNAPLSRKSDGCLTLAGHFPVSGTKQWDGKALRWILDPLSSANH